MIKSSDDDDDDVEMGEGWWWRLKRRVLRPPKPMFTETSIYCLPLPWDMHVTCDIMHAFQSYTTLKNIYPSKSFSEV